ncbi:LacI family DNA-binding transcriptional regulator [Phytomonospora sp. NPDC050363]|uniref:LacI family DNA-binding transcriptional regulator n=1 Tax=Phytomonospora sp. NPDC050363 TaxID=3155642 RepID=UPI00340821D5
MTEPGRRRAQRPGSVTIADVAGHAGVAVSTVSYVLSGKRMISETTRQRVLASIRVLGYHPHAGARSLASKRSNVIAMVLPLRSGMHLPVLMRFATAVAITARQHDHDVLLVTADEGPAGLRRLAAGSMVDGLILMDVEWEDPRVPLLRELDLSSVLIGIPSDSTGVTCVDLDFAAAGAACAEHLAELGHTSVALLGAPAVVYGRDTGFARRTRAGFLERAAARGADAVAVACEDDAGSAARAVGELLAAHPETTGIAVHNEAAVGHVLSALSALGRRVGEDTAVVAICPEDVAERTAPALSSVLIPAEDLGERAVSLLMSKLEGAAVPRETLLAPRLTVRESSARPRAGSPAVGPASP